MGSAAGLGKGPLHNCVAFALPLCANHHAFKRWVCSNKALSACSSSWLWPLRAQPQTPAMSHAQLVSVFSTLEPALAAGATKLRNPTWTQPAARAQPQPARPTQPQPAPPLQAVAPPPATTTPPRRTAAPPACTAAPWPCTATHKSMDSAAGLSKGPLHNCVSCALPLCASHHAVSLCVCSSKALSTCSPSWLWPRSVSLCAQPQEPAASHVQLAALSSTLGALAGCVAAATV